MSKPVGLTAKDGNGYNVFKIPKGCRFSTMKNIDGYVLTARLIMAEYLQRPLKDKEVVHHINGNINDNKIENLTLFNGQTEHVALHNKLRKGIKYIAKKGGNLNV